MSSAELGKRYGVTDYDGRRPDVISYFAENVMAHTFGLDQLRRAAAWHRRVVERAERWLPAAARGEAAAGKAIPARRGSRRERSKAR